MATSSIGQVVKLDNETAKAFVDAMKKPQKPIVQSDNRMTWLSDFSVLKNIK